MHTPSSLLLALAMTTCLAAETASPSAPAAAPATDPAFVWDLSLLYKDEAAFASAKAKLVADIPKLKQYQGRLGESAATLRDAMDLLTDLQGRYIRLGTYASLASDEDLRNAPAMERNQEMDMLASELSSAASFVNPELLAVGEAKLRGFLDSEPGLAVYRFPILDTLRNAPHTLGAEAESVLSSVGMIADAPSSLYGVLANADLPWPKIKLSDGSEALLNQAGYTRWRAVSNRADRQAVFEAFWGKMKEYERTFGVALFSQMKNDWFNARVRKHPSSLAAALSGGNVPEAVYRALLAETNANLPTLHRYFKLRARMLGVTDLRYWDIYPPLVTLEKKFPYDQAKALTLAAVQPLGADYVASMTKSLGGRYAHVFPRPGKRSGAYMSGSVHDAHPYVLLNYNDDYESVSTFAHEWGHGQHSVLANRTQPAPLAQYSIFTAEIASTCNEALLLDHMLKIAKDDDERLYYLGSALEGLRGTFFRQAMFAEFELRIHEEVEKGNALSGEALTKIYGEILRRYHGDAEGVLKIDDLVTVEWAYIPHFYRNFYVYQYATSIAASQAFAERILAKEPGAVETYLGLLKAGGSDYPYELVKKAGVDLATPEPYRALMRRMNSIMDQIEALLAKRGK
ncbi:MAG TPA: oligoendopeptidase F [Opitutaceae bacterium]|nr:oligoendopeptidase F [Opitutaceae bacterium]